MKRLQRLTLIAICGVIPAMADIIVSPATTSASPGEAVSLAINISNVADVYAYQFDVGFNPSILAANTVTEGGFLSSAGATTFLPGFIDNTAGSISFIADALNGPVSGASGAGTLVTIGFTAIGGGTSAVDVFNLTALNSFGEGIPLSVTGASVDVSAAPEPSSAALSAPILAMAFALCYRRRRPTE